MHDVLLCRAQVVGWPPIRSYRKNTMATNQLKSSKEDAEAKQGQGFLYVKVSMDGAPYLRKVDLKTYKNYKDLSTALEKMFIGFTTGEMSRVTLLAFLFVIAFPFDVDALTITSSRMAVTRNQYMLDLYK